MTLCAQRQGPGFTRHRLETAAAQSHSLVDMLSRLGQPLASGPLRYLRRRIAHYAIDTSHFVGEELPRRPRGSYGREALREAADRSKSTREVLEHLGVPPYDGAHRHIAKRLAHFGIDTSHFSGSPIGEAELRAAVAESVSIAGTLRALGLRPSGSGRARVNEGIDSYGIRTDHFKGQGHGRGRPAHNRRPADDVLRRQPPCARRLRRALLHRALREKGVPCVCAECGTGELWQGRRLVLEIDHVNGESGDNRIVNLRYLCPSCHSQTPTYARGRSSAAPSDPGLGAE
jgi:hypothetical protein